MLGVRFRGHASDFSTCKGTSEISSLDSLQVDQNMGAQYWSGSPVLQSPVPQSYSGSLYCLFFGFLVLEEKLEIPERPSSHPVSSPFSVMTRPCNLRHVSDPRLAGLHGRQRHWSLLC